MKLGVIGSRLFDDYDFVEKKILENFDIKEIDTIVSGGAKGVDTLGEIFAMKYNLKRDITKPDWKGLGKGAAFIRNQQIVDNSDCLIAFPIGTSGGTWDTIRKAEKQNKKIIVIVVEPTVNL